MHLWQLDIVGGVFLVDGREHKMLTATDDHSRFVVAATVLPVRILRCVTRSAAIARQGAPFEVLTDNGQQFTGKFTRPYRSRCSSKGCLSELVSSESKAMATSSRDCVTRPLERQSVRSGERKSSGPRFLTPRCRNRESRPSFEPTVKSSSPRRSPKATR